MSVEVPFPPPGFDELSIDEQYEYIGKLSERIPSPPNDPGVPDWHIEIIERELAEIKKNGLKGIPWEEVEKELVEQLNKG